jgi:threonine aldolase
MAARLATAVAPLPGMEITHPVQTNAVFATLPLGAAAALHERYSFYDWDKSSGEVRWMCSWDTSEEDVDGFAGAVAAALTGAS